MLIAELIVTSQLLVIIELEMGREFYKELAALVTIYVSLSILYSAGNVKANDSASQIRNDQVDFYSYHTPVSRDYDPKPVLTACWFLEEMNVGRWCTLSALKLITDKPNL